MWQSSMFTVLKLVILLYMWEKWRKILSRWVNILNLSKSNTKLVPCFSQVWKGSVSLFISSYHLSQCSLNQNKRKWLSVRLGNLKQLKVILNILINNHLSRSQKDLKTWNCQIKFSTKELSSIPKSPICAVILMIRTKKISKFLLSPTAAILDIRNTLTKQQITSKLIKAT